MENFAKLCRMTPEQIKQFQAQQMQDFFAGEVAVRHPFYRDSWRETGVPRSAADLQKQPFTVKSDLLSQPDNLESYRRYVLEVPEQSVSSKGGGLFGLFKGKSAGEIVPKKYATNQLLFSAGRTGKITPYVYSVADIENLGDTGLRMMEILGITRDDTIVNAMSYAPNLSFWQVYYGGLKLGSTVLQSGGGRILGTEKILTAMENMEASTLFTTPGYAEFLLQTAVHFNLKFPNLNKLIVGYGPVPLAQVKRLEVLLRMVGSPDGQVKRVYFLNEAKSAWAECSPGSGYHFYPDHAFLELDAVPGVEGRGELILTNLNALGSCVVRFRTGDLAESITYEPCPVCQRSLPRVLGEIERLDEYKNLGGEQGRTVNLSSLYSVLAAEPNLLLWQAVLHGEPAQLRIDAAFLDKNQAAELSGSLQAKLQAALGVTLTIKPTSYKELADRLGFEKYPIEQRIVAHSSTGS